MANATLPADDLKRQLVKVDPDDPNVPHFGLVGDTYTVLLSGKDSDGRYCLIDMHVPPGGDRLPIATTSKKLSFFSMVKWRPRFKERNGLCELGKRCTFRQTLLINFITPHRSQRGCFASARRHPKRSSSKSWEHRLRRVPLRFPKSMQRRKQGSSRK